jgi:hypothetical protein
MAKRLPTLLLGCLVIAVVLLFQQVMVLQKSIAELRAKINSRSTDRRAIVVVPGSETELDYESAFQLLKDNGDRIVPISDPSIERAMQIDRLQRNVPRTIIETQPSIKYLPSEGHALEEFIDLLPEVVE